jgi:eukaryotic-like serine/threonine-protein kinase
MPFVVSMAAAQADHPDYTFISPLTPSEQKAAFHVKDANGDDLCLKIIAPNYSIDRLQREILALQSIDHANVVKLKEYTYSSTPTRLRHFMVEEFIDGEDLANSLANGRPWSRADVAKFFAEVCDGLEALRIADIVHRDLKPTNIRVRVSGTPVIIDFGLARHLGIVALTNTSDGAAIGTPMYFAPEQFTGTKHDIDHRTDLFALGVITYQALTGQHPFCTAGMTRQQLCDAVCTSSTHLTRPSFASLPREWKLLVGRLLEKERAKRPQSAAQVGPILRKLASI